MSLTREQKDKLNDLLEYRDSIVKSLADIEHTIKHYFPEEFDIAYQHWIPQIVTALYEDERWLPRGQHTMQETINRLKEKITDSNHDQGVKKYI